jgi:hypothetical protein
MASIARIEGNRRNARKSTGPKDTSSTRFNAVKHGLLAEGVTELDSPETFSEFCARLQAELKPIGEVEKFLGRRIALGMVRLKRAVLLEADFLTSQLNPPVTETSLSDMCRMLAEMDSKTVVVDPGLPARLSVEAADALANTFARYETAIENRLFRALNQLERMQRLRRGETIPSPVSADIAIHGDKLASLGNSPAAPAESLE